jgi:dUTP pyrophosphatase
MELKYYKIHDEVNDPIFATDGSACFDLYADLSTPVISGFEKDGIGIHGFNHCSENVKDNFFVLPENPNKRWMIPSGLIFDVPTGYHVAVNIRGGTGLKRGLRLANGTGIIDDDDYTKETFMLIQNLSGTSIIINHNERICQARLIKNENIQLIRVSIPPTQKTQRVGGFNSTGVK